jgi:hypothetical protein
MAQDRHSEEYKNDKFCARCPCEHSDYIKCCEPGWVNETFLQKRKGGVGPKKYEAHHLLCWSCVVEAFITDIAAKAILKGTNWCVNRKPNMIALPLWGHTVKWYAHNDGPPKFANLPQHDWDHNCTLGYTSEVQKKLKNFAKDIKDAKKAHELPEPKDIASSLTSRRAGFVAAAPTHRSWGVASPRDGTCRFRWRLRPWRPSDRRRPASTRSARTSGRLSWPPRISSAKDRR